MFILNNLWSFFYFPIHIKTSHSNENVNSILIKRSCNMPLALNTIKQQLNWSLCLILISIIDMSDDIWSLYSKYYLLLFSVSLQEVVLVPQSSAFLLLVPVFAPLLWQVAVYSVLPVLLCLLMLNLLKIKQFYDDLKLTSRMRKGNYIIIVLLNTCISKKEEIFI